ncbi:6-phosphogluconolactonase (cycloisomerase 2 family) [Pseudacidovorax intermedius]|uniref:6-phosphogluconolactonase (Cycloisomerase 2 family) n=2 Tax=Pseudacidovorax intermedius TaxID=433924 RepID=A0A370FJG4_9BURK|nr:6-phosphogluconolactonase (cycloisomerase 2 family) [Pseudacidovorax intermedius]
MNARAWLAGWAVAAALMACGGGGSQGGGGAFMPVSGSSPGTSADPAGGDTPQATATFQVRGRLDGWVPPGLVLQLNGAEEVVPEADGTFAFSTALPRGGRYSVSVKSPPVDPARQCTVDAGTAAGEAGPEDPRTTVICSGMVARFAYVAVSHQNEYLLPQNVQVRSHPIDPATGALGTAPVAVNLASPLDDEAVDPEIAVPHPGGRWAYVIRGGTVTSQGGVTSTGISDVYRRALRQDGSISERSASLVQWRDGAAPFVARRLMMHPSGRFLYSAGYRQTNAPGAVPTWAALPLRLLRVDASNGAVSEVDSTTMPAVAELRFDPSGRFAFAFSSLDRSVPSSASPLSVTVYAVDLQTGLLRRTGRFDLDSDAFVSFTPDGRFAYGTTAMATGGSNPTTTYALKSFRVDPATGAISEVSSARRALPTFSRLAVHPHAHVLYVGQFENVGTPAAAPVTQRYAVDPINGTLSLLGAPLPHAVPTFDASGRFGYLSDIDTRTLGQSLRAYLVNATTGATSLMSVLQVGGLPVSGQQYPNGLDTMGGFSLGY